MKIHATTQGAGATLEEALMSQMRLSYGDARKLASLGRSSSSSSNNKSTTVSDSSLEQLVQHCQELYEQGALKEPEKPPDDEEKPAEPKVIVIHKKLKYKKPPKKVSDLRKSFHKDDDNKNEKLTTAATTTSPIANNSTSDNATETTTVVDSSWSSGTKDNTSAATTNKAVEAEQTPISASDEFVTATIAPNVVNKDAEMDENERAMAEAAAAVAAAMLEDGPEEEEEEQVVEQDGAPPMEEACQETIAVVDETSIQQANANENDLAETEQNTSKIDNAQKPESNELVDETVDETVNADEENERAMAEAAAAVAAAMLQDGPDDEDECYEIDEAVPNDSSADAQEGEQIETTTTTAKDDLPVQDQPTENCDGVEQAPGTEKDESHAAGNETTEESTKEAVSLSESVVEVNEIEVEAVDQSKTQEDVEESCGLAWSVNVMAPAVLRPARIAPDFPGRSDVRSKPLEVASLR